MKKLLLITLPLMGACGDLSNDDLVFLAGVPHTEEVTIGLSADDNPNALVGEPAEYYGHATELAAFFDGVVGTSIEFVETLGWGYPPTHRTESSRIWGPVHNIDGTGITLRLEIRRDIQDDGSPLFTYCLHAGPDGTSRGVSPTCEEPIVAGMRLLMWGSFAPRAGDDNGRAGRGLLAFDFEAIRAFDPSSDAAGLLTIGYDFSGGGNSRALDIEWVRIVSLIGLQTERAGYQFHAPGDGSQAFRFIYEGNTYGGMARETSEVDACWSDVGLGRADVRFFGGDVLPGQTGTIRECWDASQERTYWTLGFGSAVLEEEGDASACPAACAL